MFAVRTFLFVFFHINVIAFIFLFILQHRGVYDVTKMVNVHRLQRQSEKKKHYVNISNVCTRVARVV